MKSIRQIARLLEAAQRDRRGNYREYYRAPNGESILCESRGERDWWEGFCGALEEKHLKPEDFSIRDIFENIVPDGRSLADAWSRGEGISLLEAAGPVMSGQFANITGQIVFSKLLEGYRQEAFVFTQLIPTVPTSFNGEKIPGVAELGDDAEEVPEGQPYPYSNLSEDWIETPATKKRGNIIAVTKETIFFNQTGLVLRRAEKIGEKLGMNKEKRAIDCVIDENRTDHRYRWRGVTIATYGDNSGTHTWDNLAASNTLVDWSDFDAIEQLFAGMVDPNTGEPIEIMSEDLVVTPQLVHTAKMVLNATAISLQAGGFAVTGNMFRTDAGNPLKDGSPYGGSYNLRSSRQLAARMATDTSYYVGSIKSAFAYMENWPIQSVTAPPNSMDEFLRDIVTQYKASERGAFATIEPRAMVKATVA